MSRTLDEKHSIIQAAHDFCVMLGTREIFLHGGPDEDGVLGDKFLKNMRILESHSKTKPIIIHQYSVGGDWCCGMTIFDAIASCPCPILFVCHGLAASMGSIIPMACVSHWSAYRVNMPNCSWLIHDGTTDISTGLTIKQSQSWGQWELETRKQMMDFYTAACVNGSHFKDKTEKQVRASIKRHLDSKEDWWLSAREAVEFGFADAVLGDEGFENIPHIIKTWDG